MFNGSDLGKEFSAKGILERLGQQQKQDGFDQSQKQSNEVRQGNTGTLNDHRKQGQEQNHDKESSQKQENVLELLMKPGSPIIIRLSSCYKRKGKKVNKSRAYKMAIL